MLSQALERIQQGQTTIKNHNFLGMVLAQVEAIEADVSCELKVAHAAVESLELCHELLWARLRTLSLPSVNDFRPPSTDFDSEQEGYDPDFDMDFYFPDANFS
jgi:hypothetical protein